MNGALNSAGDGAVAETNGRLNRADKIFYVCAAFLLGVLAASLEFNFYLFAAATAVSVAVFLWRAKNFPRKIILAAGLSVFAGFFYYYFYLNFNAASQNLVFGKAVDFAGVVAAEPKIGEQSQNFIIAAAAPLRGKIKIIGRRFPEIKYGDRIDFRGVIRASDSAQDPPTAVYPEILKIESGHGFWLKEKLLAFKHDLVAGFRRVLPPDSAALLAGITFGYRGDFTPGLKEQMARSGTTHLVAVSGYNISILVLAMASLFGRFLSSRRTFYFTAAAILFFVLMVGGEASVVRAAIMGFLALLAKESGRLHGMRNALAATAAAMVAANPTILVFDLGFQLSFLSLVGIVYFLPALRSLFGLPPSHLGGGIQEGFWTTLSAQTAVLPLLLAKFGSFSLTAILANVFVLGVVPLTMFLGFALAAANFVLPSLGAVLGWFTALILSYETAVMKIFAQIRLPVDIPGSWPMFFIVYGLVVGGILVRQWRKTAAARRL